MNLFSEINHIQFNGNILADHPGYLRKTLVLAAVEEVSESKYLKRKLDGALNKSNVDDLAGDRSANQYRVIKQYDVSNHKEKPFDTD